MEQDIAQEFKILETGTAFISQKSKELAEKYQRKFIAVQNNEIIATGERFEEVINKVKEKGIDPSSVLIEYIPGKEEIIFY